MLRGAVEKVSALVHSPPLEGWQAKPDGVVAKVLYQSIPLLWRGGRRSLTGWWHRVCTNIVPDHSSPVEGWQAQPDGVVASCLHQHSAEPFPSFGGVAGISIL